MFSNILASYFFQPMYTNGLRKFQDQQEISNDCKKTTFPLVIIAKLNALLLKINVCAISHPMFHIENYCTLNYLMFNTCKCCGHSVPIDREE